MDHARFIAVGRSIGRGWTFLLGTKGWRLSAVGVIAALLSVQILLITLAGARMTMAAALEKGTIRLDILPSTLDQRTQELYAALSALPSVRDVVYVPNEQVLADERSRDPSLQQFLERYSLDNPFPDVLIVVPRTARAYDDVRVFVQGEGRNGIDPAALAEIAARESVSRELIGAIQTARTGANILLILDAITALFLALGLLVRLAAARKPAARREALAGATFGILALPGVTAGAVALIGCLIVAGLLAGVVVAGLSLSAPSAAVGSWLAHSAGEFLPVAPFILGLEALIALLLAWVVGRAGSTVRM